MDVRRRQSVLRTLSFRRVLAAGWTGYVLFCSGCQLVSLPEQIVSTEQPAAVEVAAPDAVVLGELEQLLGQGHWEVDRHWSTLSLPPASDDHAAQIPFRWRFVVPENLKPLPKPRDGLPTPVIPVDPERLALLQRYDWLWKEPSHSEQSSPAPRASEIKVALRALSQRPDLMGGTAAVILARQPHTDSDASEPLAAVVKFENRPVTPEMRKRSWDLRAAAAETWCQLLSQCAGDAEEHLAPSGRLLDDETLPEDVRAELYRGIARRIPPRQIPGLTEAIRKNDSNRPLSPPLVLAALDACVIHAWQRYATHADGTYQSDLWPEGLRNCRYSSDAAQRKLYGRWAVLAHQPDVLAVVKSLRVDTDLSVREAAVASLAFWDSPAARDELHAAMDKGTELEKIAAVPGLARRGLEEIERYARDDSPRVRIAIAAALGHNASRASGLILAEYLRDRSPEVQLAALEACGQSSWDGQVRAPLLLQALRSSVLKVRLAAMARLEQDWNCELAFPVDGTLDERTAAVRELAATHHVSAEVFTAFTPTESPPVTASRQEQRATIQRLLSDYLHSPPDSELSQGVAEQLLSLDHPSTVILEQELAGLSGKEVEAVYREILPRISPAYQALLRLESRDAAVRRTAARDLKELAARASLTSPVLSRLQPRMLDEQDHRVWQEIFAAVLPDATPEAAQIALVALNSAWPDVRQLACGYLEKHPQPEYSLWLLPRFQDADRAVRLKAIQVSGRCGNPVALDGFADSSETVGLRQFLTSADLQLRWEAVVAMSTLGDPQAMQEMIRQTYDPHPRQREQAVRAMQHCGQSRFVEPLLKRLWTESDPGVQAVLLDALDHLVPMDERPGLAPESDISDKINQWARWWETRQRRQRDGLAVSASTAGPSQ